jgi:antiviral helicase SLH1
VLTVLRAIAQNASPTEVNGRIVLGSRNFKIIYVAPMKALAAEVVRKLAKRLAWLKITVKELTGLSFSLFSISIYTCGQLTR